MASGLRLRVAAATTTSNHHGDHPSSARRAPPSWRHGAPYLPRPPVVPLPAERRWVPTGLAELDGVGLPRSEAFPSAQ